MFFNDFFFVNQLNIIDIISISLSWLNTHFFIIRMYLKFISYDKNVSIGKYNKSNFSLIVLFFSHADPIQQKMSQYRYVNNDDDITTVKPLFIN